MLALLAIQANGFRCIDRLICRGDSENATELSDSEAIFDCLVRQIALVLCSAEVEDFGDGFGIIFASACLDRLDFMFAHLSLHFRRVCRGFDLSLTPHAHGFIRRNRNDAGLHRCPRASAIGVPTFHLVVVFHPSDAIPDRNIFADTVPNIIENLRTQCALAETHRRAESPRRGVKVHRFDNPDLSLGIVIEQQRRVARVKEREVDRPLIMIEDFHPIGPLDRLFA